ncbi:MAG TPA: sulfur reduction protein DsrE, partial [Ornithinibacter sp.]|nr:sulfur reduction protein DsrE [Ornithinibacter sp.]
MDTPAASLVVKVTCGTEALERLNQGFTVAATALAAGVEVSLWLTGDATFMAVPGRAELVDLPDAVPLAELRDL